MDSWWEDQTVRKINFSIKWHLSEIYSMLIKWLLVCRILTGMLRDGLMILRMHMEVIELVKKNLEARQLELCD